MYILRRVQEFLDATSPCRDKLAIAAVSADRLFAGTQASRPRGPGKFSGKRFLADLSDDV